MDSDMDGYGDICDCDFNQDGYCNAADFSNPADPNAPQFLTAFMSGTPSDPPVEDMNGDGVVNSADFDNPASGAGFLSGFFSGTPGPSGLECAGIVPCP
jgi:hypothetical protein